MILCKRCGRPLRSEKSKAAGIGLACKKKQAIEDAEFEKIQISMDDILEGTTEKESVSNGQ